jgi:hypothetical protein
LEEILNSLDASLLSTFKDKGLKAYGLCELITKDDKVNPVTVDKDRKQAQIHDRFNGIFYHRLLQSFPVEDSEEFSFGIALSKKFVVRIRTFIAYKVQLGEKFIFDFVDAIPDRIEGLTDYKFVLLDSGQLIADHEAVFIQEYGNHSYEKHRTSWNIFALEYDLEFILC